MPSHLLERVLQTGMKSEVRFRIITTCGLFAGLKLRSKLRARESNGKCLNETLGVGMSNGSGLGVA